MGNGVPVRQDAAAARTERGGVAGGAARSVANGAGGVGGMRRRYTFRIAGNRQSDRRFGLISCPIFYKTLDFMSFL